MAAESVKYAGGAEKEFKHSETSKKKYSVAAERGQEGNNGWCLHWFGLVSGLEAL